MYTLKGFATHGLFANNTPGTTNAIGEISTFSRTYSQEVGEYVDQTNASNLTLLSFLSATDGTAQVVESGLATRVLQICAWFYNQTLQNAGQLYADQLLAGALTQFQTVANTFQSGAMVTDGTHWVPEWVSWTDLQNPGSFIRIWLADASFQSQYDEFTIVIVPPITPLDDFFKAASSVLAEVNAVTLPQLMLNINTAKNGHPESDIITMVYDWNDPNNSANLIPTNWTIILYGMAGDNVDSISDALEAYILANSSHSRSDWVEIFPDIFKRTEFTMVPLWQNVAIAGRASGSSDASAVYSPIANLTAALALLPQFASYPSAHINAHGTVMGHPYKSLQVGVIGSDQNRNSWFELTQVFPDLINVSSTSTDFARMSQATQTFLQALAVMIQTAETMTQYSSIPLGYTKLIRNSVLYIVYNYETIDFLVAAKSNSQFSS
jgi:hypothetical protein